MTTMAAPRVMISADDAQARDVSCALMALAGDGVSAEVSQARLAETTGMDRRTLRRVLDRLEEAEWISVERAATPNSPAVYALGRLRAAFEAAGMIQAPTPAPSRRDGIRVLSHEEATHPLDHDVVEGERYLVNPADLLAGENVRRALRTEGAFQETIRAHGVEKDLDCYVALTGLVVLDGHRRHHAATALRLETVPVRIVRVDGEADRIARQLMVNDEAAHCNAAERADAVQQLVLLGVPTAELRKRGVRRGEVEAAKAMAAAPADVRRLAVDKPDLDLVALGSLAALAEKATPGSQVLADAVEQVRERPERLAHIVKSSEFDLDEERVVTERVAELRAQGVTAGSTRDFPNLFAEAKYLDHLLDSSGQPLDVEEHAASCPGHVVQVDAKVEWDGPSRSVTGVRESAWCRGWAEHGHVNRWARPSSGATSGPLDEEARKERAEKVRRNKEAEAAAQVRRTWIRTTLLAPGGIPTVAWRGLLPHLAAVLLLWAQDSVSSIARAKGLDRLGGEGVSWRNLPTRPGYAPRDLLLVSLAMVEGQLEKSFWQDPKGYSAQINRLYLRFLERLGYTLSDVEEKFCTDVEEGATDDLLQVPGADAPGEKETGK